jgi:hypothetical protein
VELTDDQVTAQLWDLEEDGRQDSRVALADGTYLSLFLDKVEGRSYIFRRAEAERAGSDYWMYGTADEAQTAFDQMLSELRRDRMVVDEDSMEDLGAGGYEGESIEPFDLNDMQADERRPDEGPSTAESLYEPVADPPERAPRAEEE